MLKTLGFCQFSDPNDHSFHLSITLFFSPAISIICVITFATSSSIVDTYDYNKTETFIFLVAITGIVFTQKCLYLEKQ